MKIIKIHGCSGAGKTTAVRNFMSRCNSIIPIMATPNKPEAYMCLAPGVPVPVYVLGSYENTCGGMDTVGTADKVMGLLEAYAPKGHVIFEGLLQSTYYGKMGNHSRNYPRENYIYAFLDTPIDVCLDRVVIRRAASKRNNKFNPQLTVDKHATIEALKKKLELEGYHRVVSLDHNGDMAQQLIDLL